MIPFANHPVYRVLWGWLGAPEVSLLKLFQGPVIRKASVYAHVVQEAIAPLRRLSECIELFDGVFGVYPLLVFPVRVFDRQGHSGFMRPDPKELEKGCDYGLYVDLGAYGVPRQVKQGLSWDAKANIREMEHWTREAGGWYASRPRLSDSGRLTHTPLHPRLSHSRASSALHYYRSVLYTDVFCTRRELREMFDHTLLDKCTKRLDCADAFPQVFDKVKPEAGIVDLAAEVAAEEEAAAKKGGWFGGMANGGAKLEAAKKARAAASPAGARASPAKNGHNGHVNGEKKNGRNNGIHA